MKKRRERRISKYLLNPSRSASSSDSDLNLNDYFDGLCLTFDRRAIKWGLRAAVTAAAAAAVSAGVIFPTRVFIAHSSVRIFWK